MTTQTLNESSSTEFLYPLFLEARSTLQDTTKIVPFAGSDLPLTFSSSRGEHLAVRSGAGIFDVSHMLRWKLSQTLWDALIATTPLPLDAPKINRQMYSAVLDADGCIIDDIMVLRTRESNWMISNAGKQAEVGAALRAQLEGEFTDLQPASDTRMFALQGPIAEAALRQHLPAVADLNFLDTIETDGLIISRSGYTGEDGFEVFGAVSPTSALVRRLLEDERIVPCGLAARDSLRLEAGMLLSGSDLAEPLTPKEAGLGFIAKRVPAGVKSPKSNSQCLRFVRIDTARIARAGQAVGSEQGIQGRVTSGAYCPSVKCALALVLFEAPVPLKETVSIELNQRTTLEGVTIRPGVVPKRYKQPAS